MKIAVAGGDLRFAYLTRLLCLRGQDARALFMEDANLENVAFCNAQWAQAADLVMLGWPAKFPLADHVPDIKGFLSACNGNVAFCGPNAYTGAMDRSKIVRDLWNCEEYLMENAYLTAEGALHSAMSAMRRSISGSVCLVVGYGRIGSQLARLLRTMGAIVTVATRNPGKPTREGFRTVPTEALRNALSTCDAVFSTPPHLVLDATALESVGKEAIVMDLASAPFGVDLQAAQRLGLHAWREPGLPGRYCPESAAESILNALGEEVWNRET